MDNSSPILASHVFRTWRNHALSTGTLWTKDELQTRTPDFEKHRTLMDRANGAPLDVTIDETPFRNSSVKHAKEIMRLLVPHVSHLRTLEVWRVPRKILRIIFDRLAELSAPQLRKLTVKSHKNTAWNEEVRSTKWKFQPFVRTEAPNLRELNLYGINPTYVIGRFKGLQFLRLKWTGVFKGVSAYDHAKSVQELLLLLPDLQYLFLVGDGHSHNGSGDANTVQLRPDVLPPPVTHKALVHASIGADLICSDTMMASLILPKLRYVIDRDQNELKLGVACLPVLAQPSQSPFPALITLRLAGGYNPAESTSHPRNAINMSNLESALSRLKRLRSLTFDHIDFEGDQYLPCVGWMCPELEWLRFIVCHGFTMKQVRSVVEARRQQDPKKRFRSLVRLAVYWRSSEAPIVFEDGDKEWLERALKLEMKVYLRDPIAGQDYLGVVEGIRPFDYR